MVRWSGQYFDHTTSRILRIGNLCPGMPSSSQKGTDAMPLRGSPNGAGHTRPQPGRDRSEQVVAINRNRWSQSAGMRTMPSPDAAF